MGLVHAENKYNKYGQPSLDLVFTGPKKSLKDTGTGSNLSNTDPVNIGYKTYTSSGYTYFNGKISNLKVYKGKGLTAAEVEQNYNALKGRYV